jgi:hypothetical protein
MQLQPTYGSAANTVCQGDDARLSDARAPTGAAGGGLGGTYPNPSVTPAAGLDTTAIHNNVDGEVNAIASKATPVGADVVLIEDSAASFAKKKALISSLPAGGGGSSVKYDPQTATLNGTETFTVTAMVVNADVPGGYDLHYCCVQGIMYKIVTSVPGVRECRVTSSTQVEVANLLIGDDVEFLYGKA